jgi:hypothetical protein
MVPQRALALAETLNEPAVTEAVACWSDPWRPQLAVVSLESVAVTLEAPDMVHAAEPEIVTAGLNAGSRATSGNKRRMPQAGLKKLCFLIPPQRDTEM